jgi:hypothetical protein
MESVHIVPELDKRISKWPSGGQGVKDGYLKQWVYWFESHLLYGYMPVFISCYPL